MLTYSKCKDLPQTELGTFFYREDGERSEFSSGENEGNSQGRKKFGPTQKSYTTLPLALDIK